MVAVVAFTEVVAGVVLVSAATTRRRMVTFIAFTEVLRVAGAATTGMVALVSVAAVVGAQAFLCFIITLHMNIT